MRPLTVEQGKTSKTIVDLSPSAIGPALQLNNAHAKETSLLDEKGLATLIGKAFYARGIDDGATALLIALDHHAVYDNPNFEWFKIHSDGFVYIDRVIVAKSARGLGIARLLYEDLFSAVRASGHTRVVCEVNLDPPNAASDAFHAAMGFDAIGQGTIHEGAKTVRYFERIL